MALVVSIQIKQNLVPYSFRATKLNGKQWTEYLLRCSCLSFAPLPPTKVSFISIWVQTTNICIYIFSHHWGALLLYKVLKSFNADDVLKVDWDRLIISINATVTVKCSRTSQEIWMVERCGGKYIYFILCVSEERGDTGRRAKEAAEKEEPTICRWKSVGRRKSFEVEKF